MDKLKQKIKWITKSNIFLVTCMFVNLTHMGFLWEHESVIDIILLIHKYHFSDLIIFWKYYYIFKKTHFLPSPEVKMNSWHSATKWNIWHKTFLLSLKCHSSRWFCLSYATDLFCLHVKCNINPHTEKLSLPYRAAWKRHSLKKKKKKNAT